MAQSRFNHSTAKALLHQVARNVNTLHKTKKNTVSHLYDVANELQQDQKHVTRSNIASAHMALAGVGLIVTGGVLFPFTFGASAAFLGGGGTLLFSGLATKFTSMSYGYMIKKTSMKKVKTEIEKYGKVLGSLVFCLSNIEGTQDTELSTRMFDLFPDLRVSKDVGTAVLLILTNIRRGLDKTDEIKRYVDGNWTLKAKYGAQFTKIGTAVRILLVPFDIHELINEIVKLHNDEPPKCVVAIRDLAKNLDNQQVVEYTEECETIQVLAGNENGLTMHYEEYKRRVEEMCGDDKVMMNAVLSLRERESRK